MMARVILTIAAINNALAIILGAFAAHVLKSQLSLDMLAVYQTAVQYHFYHGLGLLLLGVLALRLQKNAWLFRGAILMFAGIVLFCGTLYLLALTGVRWLGAIAPIGGICLVLAWIATAVAVWKEKLL